MKKKVLVVIRDGRGYRADPVDNAIAEVDTPNTDMIMEKYPNILIKASGEDV
jgi:2,3-bisphosphoglycerate-independent phosphoglycerate mutase